MLFRMRAVAVAVGLALSTLITAVPHDHDYDGHGHGYDHHTPVPTLTPTPTTCGPSPFTTIFVTTSPITTYTTITLSTVVFLPHSCFTVLVPVPQSNNEFCGTTTLSCGPAPACVVLSTVTFPCKDPCCPVTPTLTTLGGCVTCRTGCATQFVTVTQTEGCDGTGGIPTTTPY